MDTKKNRQLKKASGQPLEKYYLREKRSSLHYTENENSLQEETKNNSFCITLHKGTKLTATVKKKIKSLGCFYHVLFKKYVGLLLVKNAVENIFSDFSISADFSDVFDPLPTKTPSENSLFIQIDILAAEIQKDDGHLCVDVEKHDPTKSVCDFSERPKEGLSIEMDFYERYLQITEKKEILSNLENSLELHQKETAIETQIAQHLKDNEFGDANIFVEKFKHKYIFDPAEGKNGSFYIWKSHFWEIDTKKQRYIDFEAVPQAYLDEAGTMDSTADKEAVTALEKRAAQLKSATRMRNVFEIASAYICLKKSWDATTGKLPAQNGIIDLKTGILSQSHPSQYVRSVSKVKYKPKATCKKFLHFLDEISGGNREWIDFMQLLIGYAALGKPSKHLVVYLYGKNGRNGKGTLINLLQSVLGNLAKSFPSEMLLLQRNTPSSSSASPELANLQGVRLALFSEINCGRRIDSAKVKNLSGGDTITCRRLFSNIDLQITPSHTIFLQTNFKPKAPADDSALWARTVIVPFPLSFVREPTEDYERPINENLQDELQDELEGILRWVVEGSEKFCAHGMEIPEFIKAETQAYREENDPIGLFLSEMCELSPEWSAPKSSIESAVREFCIANDFHRPTRLEISAYLKQKFSDSRTCGTRLWMGIHLLAQE